jgi:hypothetical protein
MVPALLDRLPAARPFPRSARRACAGRLVPLGLLALLVAPPSVAGEPPARPLPVAPGREVTLAGEVVDLECYLRDGSRGQHHKACALTCRKNGGSLALVEDRSEDLYPIAGATAVSDPGAAVAEYVGTRIAVRGQLYERAGARILVVEHAERLR